MRSLHFSDTYLPRRDGVVTSIRTLVAALTAAGQHAEVVVPRHPDQPGDDGLIRLPAVPCGIADLRMSRWLLRDAWATGALEQITAAAPDLVHVHTPGPVGLLGVLAARHLGVPLVQTYHTDLHAYADAYKLPKAALAANLRLYAHRLGVPRPDASPDRDAILDATNVLLLGGAAALVVPTRAVLERLSVPVDPDRVFVIPTGVAPRPADKAAISAFRAGYGLAGTDRVILFVGRINREKGIDRLLGAFAELGAQCPDARLVLVGAVYDKRWLAGLIQRTGLADRIVVTGQQPPGVVRAAYGCAEVFAFPSTSDTQALVLQEAALAGLPVVMVDAVLHRHGPLAGAPVLTAEDAGAFAAGIRGLIEDPGAARSVAARCAVNAAGHTPDAYAAAMHALYGWSISRQPAPLALTSSRRPVRDRLAPDRPAPDLAPDRPVPDRPAPHRPSRRPARRPAGLPAFRRPALRRPGLPALRRPGLPALWWPSGLPAPRWPSGLPAPRWPSGLPAPRWPSGRRRAAARSGSAARPAPAPRPAARPERTPAARS